MGQAFLKNIKLRRGFTLIELIITMAIFSIVIAMVAPGFKSMVANNNSTSLASELTAAVGFARTEAIKRVKRVTICPSSNGTSCLTSSDWAKGWLVFVDKAASDSATVGVETVLKYWDKLDGSTVASLKKGSTAIEYLRFNPQGMLARSGASDTDVRAFEIYIKGCKSNSGRKISIGPTGLVSTSKIMCP